jgi:hypothetical protein
VALFQGVDGAVVAAGDFGRPPEFGDLAVTVGNERVGVGDLGSVERAGSDTATGLAVVGTQGCHAGREHELRERADSFDGPVAEAFGFGEQVFVAAGAGLVVVSAAGLVDEARAIHW